MLRGVLLTATLGGAACHREASGPAPQTTAVTAPAAAVSPPGVGTDGMTKPLFQVLADEKAHRPAGTPHAEALFDALDKGGVVMQGRAQVLGRTVGAAYCENAHTGQGVVVSVCEFGDAGALAAGRAYSERTFARALPGRVLVSNRNTLLTINPAAGTAGAAGATAAQVDVIKRAFAAL